jgi:hypothetical protein
MNLTSHARQPKTLRAGFLNVLCAAGLLGSLVVPLAVHAQPAKTEAPMASHTMSAGGMNHGGDMKAMMKGMNDKMAGMTMTGNHDVDFAQMMRIHHQGARWPRKSSRRRRRKLRPLIVIWPKTAFLPKVLDPDLQNRKLGEHSQIVTLCCQRPWVTFIEVGKHDHLPASDAGFSYLAWRDEQHANRTRH